MEAAEGVKGPKELTNIVKGKRTKRQRPHSPIPFTITEHSWSSNRDSIISNSSSSPASSGDYFDSTTTEDEDTAKCLILLAQGRPSDQYTSLPHKDKDEDYGGYKFNSKKYIETSSTGNGKAGMYVYECRTCNRTFPSFQALGGHRASHKKLKLTLEDKKQLVFSDDDEEIPIKRNISSLSLQLSNGGLYTPKTPKTHECSICGTEFTSGQALGGHMRRHRTPMGATNNAHLSMNQVSSPSDDHSEEARKTRNFLSLDLNLPASEPEDDHHKEAKFAFTSKQQNQQHQQDQQQKHQQEQQKKQSALVLSATPTLVDCHY